MLDRQRCGRLAVAKFSRSGASDKVPEGSTLISGDTQFPQNTVQNRWKKVSMPKTNSIRPVILIQYQLVTDGQTDRNVTATHTALA